MQRTGQRMGMVIGLQSDKVEAYKQLHAAVWPEVLDLLSRHDIRNYSIFLKEPENLLFGYWEYHGTDFNADMQKMAADERNQQWWSYCIPCQRPFETRKDGEWWAMMDELFHLD